MNFLNQILAYKRQELEVRKLFVPETELYKSKFFNKKCISLKTSLLDESKTGIIAEFKRRSPSRGMINKAADVLKVTKAYTANGASGLSILTDKYFFGGNSSDLVTARKNNIPILRKDFVTDPYDLIVSKAIGADVILLIAACLSKAKVRQFASLSKELGMEVLLEVHDEKEIGHICYDVDMVGINNRNLKTFEVDIQRSLVLSKLITADKIKVAESGIDDIKTIDLFKRSGYKGFLMGERFMKEPDPGKAFKEFVKLI
ncbi:MAG: indole-3-glycerol phosphate synthase TrpC [Ferruginibacter sp.]